MPNRLADETSPYLLQHAHNPVDWYPWGPEALERARREDRPILLSVGYSACHWCHVMERESFEDPALAAKMNADFVCIKVDREERPDVDELYMRAVQRFQRGHGGWPMTVFLTPAGQPFWGGTYFPPTRRGGMPGFDEVLAEVVRLYRTERDRVGEIAEELTGFLQRSGQLEASGGPTDVWLEQVAASAQRDFDVEHAGFGGAPKFPAYGTLRILAAHYAVTGARASGRMLTRTLDAMARGGMYDLVGGGFARYSVDAAWRVPHFEKMLYDNAQLVPLYCAAARMVDPVRAAHYRQIVARTLAWGVREMRLPHGGFAASLDADTEGEEGRFYVWTAGQLRDVLDDDAARASELLQVTEEGTFEHGNSVLRLEDARVLDADAQAWLDDVLARLGAARELRTRPARDDKVITAWNALWISALAKASADEAHWLPVAEQAARFLLDTVTIDGRLMRSYKDGQARHLAFADDHAALLLALLDLYEASFEPAWLDEARAIADAMLALFYDDASGALFYTGSDAEPLIARGQNPVGGAEPSANGLAALGLVRLGKLTGAAELLDRAARIVSCYQGLLQRAPRALGHEALAGYWLAAGGQELGLVGALDDPDTQALLSTARARHRPFSVTAVLAAPDARIPWMEGRSSDRPTAWLCEGFACQLPTHDPAELARQLEGIVDKAPVRVRAPELPSDPASWLNTARPLTLAELRGHVVVLDFWTYCCINCMHILPELEAVERHFAGQPVVVIGVHAPKFPAEKERENVARAIERHGIRHPVVLDPEHTIWQAYTVKSWPTVAVVDPAGRICWQEAGEVGRQRLIDVVQDALEEASGALVAPVWQRTEMAIPSGGLHHPGKVSTWPDAEMQARGAAPFGPDARLYVSDTGHHRILECTLGKDGAGWPVLEVARSFGGEPGFADGGSSEARFRNPQGTSRLEDTLFVADTENHAIRAIDLDTGDVRTVAGTGRRGAGGAFDPNDPRGADLRSPWDVSAIRTGQGAVVFIAMAGTHQIWVWLEGGQLGPFAGTGREDHIDGPAAESAFAQPSGIEVMGHTLLVADSEISSVRAVDLDQRVVKTVVGRGLFDFGDIDGAAGQVRLQHPLDLTAIGQMLYVADTYNHKVKAIDQTGATRTLAGGRGIFCEPGGIASVGPFLVVADSGAHRLVAIHHATGEVRELRITDR